MTEPPPMAVLPYATPVEPLRPKWLAAARVSTLVALIICITGSALIPLVDVETVIGTGPALFIVACMGCGAGLRLRRTDVWALHASHAAIVLLFVMLVNVLNWSPDKARVPFLLMSGAWAIVATVWTAIVFRRLPPSPGV